MRLLPSPAIVRQVDRWIDAHKKDLVDLTCRLVNIDTTVPPGLNYPRISQLLASELKDLGVTPTVSLIPEASMRRRVSPEVGLKGPRPNTYSTLNGEGEGPWVLLNGHVDVVPADPSGWSHDPFEPVVKNGKIYGRGSADMKGSDACQIYSLKALVETGAKFNGSIIPTFTTDEEKAPQVQREVEQVVGDFARNHRAVKVSMKPILGYDPMVTPPNHRLVRTVRKVARRVLGRDVPPCGSQGSTDVAAVTALGVPVVVLGTTRRDSKIHGIDEHVRINDLVSVTKILAHTYLELL